MPILLSELLKQIEEKKDSNTLTFEQATELYKLFIINNVKTQQSALLKQVPFHKSILAVNGDEIEIESDINITFRPRHNYLKTNFSQLSEINLLSAVTINTFEDKPFAAGGMTELIRSVKQYHYNEQNNQFESKENNKKVLRCPKAGTAPIEKPSEDKQQIIKERLGKNSERGLYWLNDISISPFIDGFSFDKFIGSKPHKEILFKNPVELKKIVMMLCIQFALLHERGFVHQDAKPANLMYSKGKVLIIDYDFLRSLIDTLHSAMGTLEFVPLDILNEVNNSKKPNAYQDIYGLLITISLLLNPGMKSEFNNLANILLINCQKGYQTLHVDMKRIEEFFINKSRKDSSPWFNKVIYTALIDKKTSALQIVSHLLATDKSMMSYFAGSLIQNHAEQLAELNAHINLYCIKYPEIFEVIRHELASYMAECLSGKSNYSNETLIEKFGIASQVESSFEEKMLDHCSISSIEELKTNLQNVINFINKSTVNNDKSESLKEEIIGILLDRLQENLVSTATISLTVSFLTKGNETQINELQNLFTQQLALVNFPGRPELKAGYDTIINTLINGLKNNKLYKHTDAMQTITDQINATKPKSKFLSRRKERQPSGSMISAGAMNHGVFFNNNATVPSALPTITQEKNIEPSQVLKN